MSDLGLGPFGKTGGIGAAGKSLYYKTNGTGRDTYINSNNGGFTNHFGPIKGPDVGKFAVIFTI